jgi:hypothetical protein
MVVKLAILGTRNNLSANKEKTNGKTYVKNRRKENIRNLGHARLSLSGQRSSMDKKPKEWLRKIC